MALINPGAPSGEPNAGARARPDRPRARGAEIAGQDVHVRPHTPCPAYLRLGLRPPGFASTARCGEPMATSGEKRWPPMGRSNGRHWGVTNGRWQLRSSLTVVAVADTGR